MLMIDTGQLCYQMNLYNHRSFFSNDLVNDSVFCIDLINANVMSFI